MSGAILVRPAGAADLPALTTLLVTQLREHAVDLPDGDIAAAAAGMLNRPQRGRFLVAADGAELIGFAAVSFLWTLEHGGWAAWLDELYVVPERRGRGIGQTLLDAVRALAAATGAAALDLEIENGHERAASLYQRNGFVRLRRTRWTRPLPASGSGAERRAAAAVMHGGCFCAAIRYRIDALPLRVSHCHCSMCRRISGAPFVTWATVAAGAIRFISGTPAVLRSSPHAERQLCTVCGTPLTFREHARPEWIDVTIGSLDDANAVRPDEHIWTASQLEWLQLDDDLPRHPQRAPSG